MYKIDIKISDELNLRYIQNELIANVMLSSNGKKLLTKSAHLMTFKGLLNCIAFYTHSNHYAIDEDGTILYSDIIAIDSDYYLQLEDNLEYFNELENTILKDIANSYQIKLYSNNSHFDNDLVIGSYNLDQFIINLFSEIRNYKTNDLYKPKENSRKRLESIQI